MNKYDLETDFYLFLLFEMKGRMQNPGEWEGSRMCLKVKVKPIVSKV